MRWPAFWGSSAQDDDKKPALSQQATAVLDDLKPNTTLTTSSPKSEGLFTTLTNVSTYSDPSVLIPTLVLTTALLTGASLSRRYLVRIPNASHIPSSSFRKRSVFGRVTSVGDADNFRLYHTPGGRLAGWGWLRRIPTAASGKTKVKSDETIHVRIAGVDAPELAHFGQPAQPYGEEALAFLKSMVHGRRVRVWLWRPDQYGRVVGTVYVRRWLGLWKTDVGQSMLKAGMATIYEAKTGAEFGGKEETYRRNEAAARSSGKGLWSLAGKKGFESPRQFKDRGKEESGKMKDDVGFVGKAVKTTRSWLMFWK